MKSLNFKQHIASLILITAFLLSLITSDFFYNPTSFAYYSFCIATFILTIICAFNYLSPFNLIAFKRPVLFLSLWCFYIFFQFLNNKATPLITLYFFTLFFLLIGITALLSSKGFEPKILFYGIILISALQSLYCISQFSGLFKSHSPLYNVTGSYNNPNVTAIFLALTTPVFLYFFKNKYKRVFQLCFLLMLTALFLLKCRAAFIGTVLSTVVFYGLECDFISWVKDKKNRTAAKALLIISLIIIVSVSTNLYNVKKASADGRKFIWKVSTEMAIEKPLTGYGYGYFEKEYNLYQADYIKNAKATTEEVKNAGPVIMPHNELILNAVEGGAIGLLLTLLFFGSLLFAVKKRKKVPENELDTEAAITAIKSSHFNLSYAGFIAFVGMSMVNSTIQIVPIMCLLVLYAAIICNTLVKFPSQLSFQNNKTITLVVRMATITLSLYLICTLVGIAASDRKNKKAQLLLLAGHYEQSLKIMPALQPYLNQNPDYWRNYGNLYFETHHYQSALACFIKAKKWSSLPDLYYGTGNCYEKLGHYAQAIEQYETLIALYPSKFSYKMVLLQTYLKNKETNKAIALAQKIVELRPKIPSEKVQLYKQAANALLKKLTISESK